MIASTFTDYLWLLADRLGQSFFDSLQWFFAHLRGMGDQWMASLIIIGQQAMPSVNWASAQATLDQINYIFPLGETMSYAVILLSLWAIVWAYRLVKSWVPTVSS